MHASAVAWILALYKSQVFGVFGPMQYLKTYVRHLNLHLDNLLVPPPKGLFCCLSWNTFWHGVPTTQATPRFLPLKGSPPHSLWGWITIINQLREVENSILGFILLPTIKIYEISTLGIFGSIHCVSNGFFDQVSHSIDHLFFWHVPNTFLFNVAFIVCRVQLPPLLSRVPVS